MKTDWLECKSVNEPFSFDGFLEKLKTFLNINKIEFEVTTGLNRSHHKKNWIHSISRTIK